MTIEQFELLDDGGKEKAVWEDGILLINYEEGNEITDVYKFFGFYVSFRYEIYGDAKVKIISDSYPNRLLYL